MLHRYRAEAIDAYPVSRAVNKADNEGPELIAPEERDLLK